MLQYFYLVYLLVCIDSCFCYDYISEEHAGRSNERLKKHYELKNENKENKDDDPLKYPFYLPEGQDTAAKIDVSSFIQQPENDAIDEDVSYHPRRDGKRRISYNYNQYGSLSGIDPEEVVNKDDRGQDYTNLDASGNGKLEDSVGTLDKNIDLDEFSTEKAVTPHKQQKKYSIKFPFFSRKKVPTVKPKKGKKRKLCLPCTKKISGSSSYTTTETSSMGRQHGYKINKRSYGERLCPMCKNKISSKIKRHFPENIFHNSRQYLQENQPSKEKLDNGSKNVNDVDNLAFDEKNDEANRNMDEARKRRETDSERRLKELEKIERKVNNVDVDLPMYKAKGST